MGFELNTKMNFAIIYLIPYSINKINCFVVDKYQKINNNYKEYVSKSLLYHNYKLLENKFHSEFDYMFETYLIPRIKKLLKKKLVIMVI
jgi:hypothetical protein